MRAAQELGCDQATISRRIAELERRAGQPLFTRRTTGAQPTAAARPLIEAAENAATAINHFERLLVSATSSQPVSVSCPEGLASYVIAPCLGSPESVLPLGVKTMTPLPRLTLVPMGTPADIAIILVQPGKSVPIATEMKVKRIGALQFTITAGLSYLKTRGTPDTLADLRKHALLQHSHYDVNPAFEAWTQIVHSGSGPVLTTPTSSGLHRAALSSTGLALLPNFAPLLDPMISLVSCGFPQTQVDIWLASHPDTLRLHSVRHAYDALAELFATSPWLRGG